MEGNIDLLVEKLEKKCRLSNTHWITIEMIKEMIIKIIS